MDNSLLARLGSLSEKERYLFYKRLADVLNDKYSCFVYGGMNDKDYANIPKEKLEKLKINLYNNMFEKVAPPRRILIDTDSPKEKLERFNHRLFKEYFNKTIYPAEIFVGCKASIN